MPEYIDRGKLIADLSGFNSGSFGDFCEVVKAIIESEPSADVEPVRHGRWISENGSFDKRDKFYHCSECRRTINIICGDKLSNYPYCNCGAKMDIGGEEK